MKFSLLFLVVAVLALNACTTLSNRRDVYSPNPAKGPYTDMLSHHEKAQIEKRHIRVDPHQP